MTAIEVACQLQRRGSKLPLRNTRKTECGADLFLIRLAVRAAPFALLRNTRKTECGAICS
jgi:hypothetical protein